MNGNPEGGTEEKNRALVISFINEVFNNHNVGAADNYYAGDHIEHNPQIPQGREGFKKYFTEFFNAFPDARASIDNIVAEADCVMVFLSIAAIHKGTLQCIPPSGKQVTIRSADLFRIENGKIAEHWDVVDSLGMMIAIEAVRVNNR